MGHVVHRAVRAGARSAGALILVALVGCGIGPESTAHRADPADVPFNLLTPPTVPVQPASGPTAGVYFLGEEHLVEVPRSLSGEGDLTALLEALSAGPTSEEQALGLSSSLPPGEVDEVTTDRGVASVDLRATFADLRSSDQALAIAQIVYTLTGQPGIGRVGFTLDDERIEIPRGDGALTTEALARDDFPELAPAP